MYDVERYVLLKNIDIFYGDEYLDECCLEFVVNRAIEIIKNKPHRLLEIVEKIKENCDFDYYEILNEFDKHKDEVIECLGGEKFLINNKNDRALYYLPYLYLKSLQNDYEYTINYKCHSYLPDQTLYGDLIIENERLFDEYYKVLVDNNYCISDEVEHPLFVHPVMVLASLHTDRKKTYACCGLFFNSFGEKVKKFVYRKGFVENYLEKDNCLPQFIVENSFVLENILKNNEKVECALRILSRENYSLAFEEEVLRVFNVENGDIDEFFGNLCCGKLKKTRNTLTFEEKILFTFYVKKLMYYEGVENHKVELFAYTTNSLYNVEPRGQLIGKSLQVFVTQKDSSLRDMLFTIVHEMMHAKQNIDIKKKDFKADSDIDIYCKDNILGRLLPKKYYKVNYHCISYEDDANFKAEVKVAKLLNEFEKLFETYKVLGEKELLKNKTFLTDMIVDSGAKFSMTREFEDKKYHIDLLFEIITSKYLESGISLQDLFDEYPIVKYEFNVQGNIVKKRSIKELIQKVNESDNIKDRNIYFYLIRQMLDPSKNFDYLDNIEELKKCIVDQGDYIKRHLEKILSKKHHRLKKYANYKNI